MELGNVDVVLRLLEAHAFMDGQDKVGYYDGWGRGVGRNSSLISCLCKHFLNKVCDKVESCVLCVCVCGWVWVWGGGI